MIKKKEEMNRGPIEIDLTGPEGNVFVLMGYAKRFARQIWGNEPTPETEFFMNINEGLDLIEELADVEKEKYGVKFDINSMGDYICHRMMESDYENAVNVFDEYFGSFVILYR
ncbi:MAG: hypothetical protein ACFFKA_00225 [Candidatus Thorarchaeota archaeon]